MKFVLDTNIIISAMLKTDSIPSEVFSFAIKKENQFFYSPPILDEYLNVINYVKFNFSIIKKREMISLIKERGICFTGKIIKTNIKFIDAYDQLFYELAKELNCYLITGNKKHYPNDSMILTPREFIDKLRILS